MVNAQRFNALVEEGTDLPGESKDAAAEAATNGTQAAKDSAAAAKNATEATKNATATNQFLAGELERERFERAQDKERYERQ